jgi:hypothetical protein
VYAVPAFETVRPVNVALPLGDERVSVPRSTPLEGDSDTVMSPVAPDVALPKASIAPTVALNAVPAVVLAGVAANLSAAGAPATAVALIVWFARPLAATVNDC